MTTKRMIPMTTPSKPKMRTCKTCGYKDLETLFPRNNNQLGKVYYRTQCKICYNKSQIEGRARRATKGHI